MKRKNKMPKPRVVWSFNPVTRKVPSAKVYRRSSHKQQMRKDLHRYGA